MRETTSKHYFKIFLNLFLALITGACFIFVVPKVLMFFVPFLIGWIISMVAQPVVLFIEKHLPIKRKPVSALVVCTAIAVVALLLYGIGYMLVHELIGFAASIPEMVESIKVTLQKIDILWDGLLQRLPFKIDTDFAEIYEMISEYAAEWTTKLGTPTVNALSSFAKNIPGVIVGIVMCLLSAYFFIAEKESLIQYAKRYTPHFIQEKWKIIYDSLFGALGGYIKAQFKIEFLMYFVILLGLMFFKVKYALLIALVIAFLDLLPVFGTGTVLIPWAIIKVFDGDFKMAIGLGILWGVTLLFRQIIQPKIVGDSIGLAPLPTLFLIYIGWQFGGVVGMLIAVPIGVLLINLNKAGIFDNVKESVQILSQDIQAFRTYNEADRNYHKHYLEKDSFEEEIKK